MKDNTRPLERGSDPTTLCSNVAPTASRSTPNYTGNVLNAHKHVNHTYGAINTARARYSRSSVYTHTSDVNVREYVNRGSGHNETVVWRRKADGRRDGGSKWSARKWRRTDAEGQRRFARASPASRSLKRDTRHGPFRGETIVVFRNVAIQNTWSILTGATNNGRIGGVRAWRKRRLTRVTKLNYVRRALRSRIISFFSFFLVHQI